MRQKSTFFSITLFVLVLTASVHSQPRLNDATNSTLPANPTITIAPSSTYKVYCYTPGLQKDWYKINGSRSTFIVKDPTSVPDHGYARRSASGTLGLHFEPFRTNDIGEYHCGFTTPNGQPLTTLTIYLTTPSPVPTPTPMPPSKVQGVNVRRTVQGSSPALRVSWSAVSGSGINYTVCYSTTSGTQSDPPSGADCSASEITGTSTTLGPLSIRTTYYIWVAAVSSGGRGPFSDRRRGKTYQVPSQVGPPVLTKAASSDRPALGVSWTAPSSDRPITKYQVQYRTSGSTSWSTKDVTSSSTTLENLSTGSSYQVRVRAVSDAGDGQYSRISTKTTYRVPEQVTGVGFTLNNTNNVLTLTITWDSPSSELPITHYFVRFDETQQRTRVAGVTTLTITGTPGSTYNFSIIAVSAVGSGAWSESVTAQPPSQPAINVTTPSTTTLTVRWDDEEFNYRLYVQKKGSTEIKTCGPVTPPYKITGLESNTEYTVVVEAYNPLGSANRSAVGFTLPEVNTPSTNPTTVATYILIGVLVVVLVMIFAAAVVIIYLILVYKSQESPSEHLSNNLEDIEVKASGKDPCIPLVSKSVQSEDSESICDVHIRGLSALDNGDVHIKGDSVSYKANVNTKGVSVSDNVSTDTNDSTLSKPITKSQFVAHVRMMHMDEDSGFEKEFETIINDPDGCETIAKANKKKNRYLNIHTYDHSRVVLSVPDENGNDYINASYIDDYQRKNAYIASQGPISATVGDFWRMVFDQQCSVIVMLTEVVERGTRKCEKYWPEVLNTPTEKGKGIMVTMVNFEIYRDYKVREFIIVDTLDESSSPLFVKHFLFTGWPDHGVPQHPASLVKFTQKVRRAYQQSPAPLLVHCSAGVGRTGTFITIDTMMQRMEEKGDLNIHEFVTQMRSRRKFMVHNQDQYMFIHDALADYITCGDTSIPVQELSITMAEICEVDTQTKKNRLVQQFEFLKKFSKAPSREDSKFASKHTIAKKNRYSDRYPYSTCYLHIPGRSPSNCKDYINASYIDSYSQQNVFIAAQSPMNSTLSDFWELIWQLKLTTVVLLCNFVENKHESCMKFWPREKQRGVDYGIVRVNHEESRCYDGYDEHKLEVLDKRRDITPNIVTVFHFWDWPIDSPPTNLPSLLKLMEEVDNVHKSKTKPVLVACDDGMARTGVFIAAMSEVERVKAEGEIDLFQTVKAARSKRPHMVSTPEQYRLCFKILEAYLDSIETHEYSKLKQF